MARIKTSSSFHRSHQQNSSVQSTPHPTPHRLGLGLGKSKGPKRHHKIMKDTIQGITRNDVRRLARRGGVKRISANIYSEIRLALRQHLRALLSDIVAITSTCDRKTVAISDVVYALKRRNNPIYGFGDSERSSLRANG